MPKTILLSLLLLIPASLSAQTVNKGLEETILLQLHLEADRALVLNSTAAVRRINSKSPTVHSLSIVSLVNNDIGTCTGCSPWSQPVLWTLSNTPVVIDTTVHSYNLSGVQSAGSSHP